MFRYVIGYSSARRTICDLSERLSYPTLMFLFPCPIPILSIFLNSFVPFSGKSWHRTPPGFQKLFQTKRVEIDFF